MIQETSLLKYRLAADVALKGGPIELLHYENLFSFRENMPPISPLFRKLFEQEANPEPSAVCLFDLKRGAQPYSCFLSFQDTPEWDEHAGAPNNLVMSAKQILDFFVHNLNLLKEENWFLVSEDFTNPNPSTESLKFICIWRKSDGTYTLYDKEFHAWGMLGGVIGEESQIIVPAHKVLPVKRIPPSFDMIMRFNNTLLPRISDLFFFGHFTKQELFGFLGGSITQSIKPEVLVQRKFEEAMDFNKLLPEISLLYAQGAFTLEKLFTFLPILKN